MKTKFLTLLLIVVAFALRLSVPTPVSACNFAAGESWCGNCGYTCIAGWQTCPGTSQCGGAGSVDLRTVPPDTNTGGSGGVVPDGNGGYKSKPVPTTTTTTTTTPPASSAACSGSYPTAKVCWGKSVGYKPTSDLVCTRTTGTLCAASYSSASVGDTNGDGVSGSVVSNSVTDQARGACPFVITCNCNGTQKQQCQDQNIYNATQVEGHCRDHVCPAIGTNGKVCDPGTVQCLNDGTSKGYVCNNAGTDWNKDPVSAHACGATGTTVNAYCAYSNRGVMSGCYSDLNTCNQNMPIGGQCRTSNTAGTVLNPDGSTYTGGTGTRDIPDNCVGASSGTRYFDGCGGPNNDQNCYLVCNGAGSSTRVCEASQLSCGARVGDTTVVTPPAGNNETPASPNPVTSPTPTTTVAPQCTGLAQSIAAPKIGDEVSFTCSASMENLITRYEFRYAVSTSADPITADEMQALEAVQGQPHVSQPITVDKVGRYFAQCRPCTANSCLAWEDATQITTGGAE